MRPWGKTSEPDERKSRAVNVDRIYKMSHDKQNLLLSILRHPCRSCLLLLLHYPDSSSITGLAMDVDRHEANASREIIR